MPLLRQINTGKTINALRSPLAFSICNTPKACLLTFFKLRYKIMQEIIKNHILVLDGAMGTMIQRYGFEEKDYRGNRFANAPTALKGNHDILVLTQPDAITDIHKAYLEAGADVIETNTFNANAISLSDYQCPHLAYELNFTAAQLARQIAAEYATATKPRFVAGSIGPTGKSLSIPTDVDHPSCRNITFAQLYDAYYQQIKGLAEGGADVFLVETIFDALNAKAALVAIEDYNRTHQTHIPVMLSVTLSDKSGRTLAGQTLDAFYTTFADYNLLSIGLNCGCGTVQITPYLEELARISRFPVCVYPNAGLPDRFGCYTQSPDDMARDVEVMLNKGWVNIIGGCCGTTPEHIRKIAATAKLYPPRKTVVVPCITALAGLETVKVGSETNFIRIGERTNVAGSRKFARLIRQQQYEEAVTLARVQIEAGAEVIDVCMDDAMIDAPTAMYAFLNRIAAEPDIARVPVMIDSSRWEAIETGLQCIQGKPIVNSIHLKDGEEAFLEKAAYIRKFGAAVVVMLFDERGQADTFERKIEIAQRAYHLLRQKADFPPHNIIIDPNILAISTGMEEHNAYAVDYIRCCRWVKQNLPHVKISGGVSNLSFAYRGNETIREAIHAVFLYHAVQAGMDMGIVNPSQLTSYADIDPQFLPYVEDVVLNKNKNATEHLLAYSTKYLSPDKSRKDAIRLSDECLSDEERLKDMLLKGSSEGLETVLDKLLQQYSSPVQIIEQPLMEGMNRVGDLFGEGKMFLPQVIQSARVMKKSVAYLEPFLAAARNADSEHAIPKIVLATVKGDVHDIGKNIVGIVLSCSGCRIVDLGVMVSARKIIDTAITEQANMIGLCGLITPSLDEMIVVLEEAQQRRLRIPILIGGAAASQLHTAVAMADKYSYGVVYVKDASVSVDIVKHLLSPASKEAYLNKIHQEYESIRQNHAMKQKPQLCITLEEARANKLHIDWRNEPIFIPRFLGVKVFDDIDLRTLIPFIHWKGLYHVFRLQGDEAECQKIRANAEDLLARIIQEKSVVSKAVVGIFPANSLDEDIILYNDTDRSQEICRLHASRSLISGKQGGYNLSLADYIAPVDSGLCDYIGCFAATAGIGVERLTERFHSDHNPYQALLLQSLADRLAEAAAEYLHLQVRHELWGFPHEGIRPAVGYPVYPQHSQKQKIFDLLDVHQHTSIELTETYAMSPAASVCGLYLANQRAKYFC
jgi:5-methyltetrahydrofolate--homocysteine methyltransferase